MGLFDDDSDYDNDNRDEPRRRDKGSRRNKHGTSHKEIFQDEFSMGSWNFKHVLVVLILLVFAGGFFIMKFGSDPGTISDRIKGELGVPSKPLPGVVDKAESVDNIQLSIEDRNQVTSGQASLVGLAPAGDCYTSTRALRKALPADGAVKVSFFTKLGRKDEEGVMLVRLRRKDVDVNEKLLRAGAARLDTETASAAGQLKTLRAAERSARRADRGLWADCP